MHRDPKAKTSFNPHIPAPLVRAPPLIEEWCGVRELGIKDCGRTITGTVKDFRSRRLMQILDEGEPSASAWIIVSTTYGNAGYSLGRMAQIFNRFCGQRKMRVVNFVDFGLDERIKAALSSVGEIIEIDVKERLIGTYDPYPILYHRSQTFGELRERYDSDRISIVFPEDSVYLKRGLGLYADLAASLLRVRADRIYMPFGMGELFAGFVKDQSFRISGSRDPCTLPELIAATVPENALFRKGWGGSIADKLVTPYTPFGGLPGEAVALMDEEILEAFIMLKKAGQKAEPTAAAAFAAVRKTADKDSRVVVINTGEGLYPLMKIDPAITRY